MTVATVFGVRSCGPGQRDATFEVSSNAGWVRIPLSVQPGKTFKIAATGSWTVDYRNFPQVGPEGYDETADAQIFQGCKVAPYAYAKLLGKFGTGPVFPVGSGGSFTDEDGGSLFLRINDAESCFSDNDGTLTVHVTV
ncbi:hypothetical protein OG562_24990 [Streptomyces sp. NBC_01275]|uniref:hypothetical protein n=1 Tax=Streptomyces sp. NBC_01275 TaxID=2903807 RepID=UPI00224ED16B|nr:hypothetical protein [Streptomyces sp. NBC_01275]MCX4764156.1 hypothetical protein [Streptomyces sp. NBC_01275]